MITPPEDVLEAALQTIHWALIYSRNLTLQPTVEAASQINGIMEALHEIPHFLTEWKPQYFDELRLHLAYFDPLRWPDAPNLVQIFDLRLAALRQTGAT